MEQANTMDVGSGFDSPQQPDRAALLSGKTPLLKAVNMSEPQRFEISTGLFAHAATPEDMIRIGKLNKDASEEVYSQAVIEAARKYKLTPDEVSQLAYSYKVDTNPRVQNLVVSQSYAPNSQQQPQSVSPVVSKPPTVPEMPASSAATPGIDAATKPVAQQVIPRLDTTDVHPTTGEKVVKAQFKPLIIQMLEFQKTLPKNSDIAIKNQAMLQSIIEGEPVHVHKLAEGDHENLSNWENTFRDFQASKAPTTGSTAIPTEPVSAQVAIPAPPPAPVSKYQPTIDHYQTVIDNVFKSGQATSEAGKQMIDHYTGLLKQAQDLQSYEDVTKGKTTMGGFGGLFNAKLKEAQRIDSMPEGAEKESAKNNYMMAAATGLSNEGIERKEEAAATTFKATQPMKMYNEARKQVIKEMTAANGEVGIQNKKVDQAIHLRQMSNGYKQPDGTYKMNKAQAEELVLGLSNLLSSGQQATVSAQDALTMKSLQEKIGEAFQYTTGDVKATVPSDFIKLYSDMIDRQGEVSEDLRNNSIKGTIQPYINDIGQEGTTQLYNDLGMNSFKQFKQTGDLVNPEFYQIVPGSKGIELPKTINKSPERAVKPGKESTKPGAPATKPMVVTKPKSDPLHLFD